MEFGFGTFTLILFAIAVVFVIKTVNVVPQQHAWVVTIGQVSCDARAGLENRAAFH